MAEFPAPGRGLRVPDFDVSEIDSELAAVEGDPFDVTEWRSCSGTKAALGQ